jgi:hypothetical protein
MAFEFPQDFWYQDVTVTGPGGSQPYSSRYYASEAGQKWLNDRVKEVCKNSNLPTLFCEEKSASLGPFVVSRPMAMLGEMNAGELLKRIEVFDGQTDGSIDTSITSWGNRSIKAILYRAAYPPPPMED